MSRDYILQQIEDMTRWLATVIFMKRAGTIEVMDEEAHVTAEYLLLHRIRELLAEHRINEAENLLFHTLSEDPRPQYLPVALEFYDVLAQMSDALLEASHFSRAEVAEGLDAVTRLYGRAQPPST